MAFIMFIWGVCGFIGFLMMLSIYLGAICRGEIRTAAQWVVMFLLIILSWVLCETFGAIALLIAYVMTQRNIRFN